jgi:hypothetical protein
MAARRTENKAAYFFLLEPFLPFLELFFFFLLESKAMSRHPLPLECFPQRHTSQACLSGTQ